MVSFTLKSATLLIYAVIVFPVAVALTTSPLRITGDTRPSSPVKLPNGPFHLIIWNVRIRRVNREKDFVSRAAMGGERTTQPKLHFLKGRCIR